ncbi:helix-turn-helix domain-containing protein [Streptomyces iconiensis]|uniref:helix-turn-helix domain-containing protein n=1 Tax=Streptomyces iconiensis TaxID=1384038 RepID=UPI003D2F52F2
MAVELRHPRAFLAIAQEGGITSAAARLRVSRSALPRTLRRLETHLGVRPTARPTIRNSPRRGARSGTRQPSPSPPSTTRWTPRGCRVSPAAR